MTPAQPIQTATPAAQPQQAAPQQSAPDTDDASNGSVLSDEDTVSGESVNLARAYSRLNGAIAALFDSLGIRRSATIPHIDGQSMSDHIQAIGAVLPSVGGVTNNMLTATHSKHDPNGGATIAHPAAKLRETTIPKNYEPAKAAVAACRNFVNKAAFLLGDDTVVKTAKSQLDLIGKFNMSGMTAFDCGVALLSVPSPIIAEIARAHSGTKDSGHAPHLRAPKP
jgi:hypothetical protein